MSTSIYTPRAGMFPPYLAGRDLETALWEQALDDAEANAFNRAQAVLLTGARGSGKTAVLTEFQRRAHTRGFDSIRIDAVLGKDTLISSLTRHISEKAAAHEGRWKRAASILERLGSVSLGAAGFSGGVTFRPADASPADDARALAEALSALADETRRETGRGGILLLADELHDATLNDLSVLTWLIHTLGAASEFSPVVFAGAALPHVMSNLANSASFGPRIYKEVRIPVMLSDTDARDAVTIPALDHGLEWDADALEEVVSRSHRHPAFLQLYADAIARQGRYGSRIGLASTTAAIEVLDREVEDQLVAPRVAELTDFEVAFLGALDRLGGAAQADQLMSALSLDIRAFLVTKMKLIDWGDVVETPNGTIEIALPHVLAFARRHSPASTAPLDPTLPAPELEP